MSRRFNARDAIRLCEIDRIGRDGRRRASRVGAARRANPWFACRNIGDWGGPAATIAVAAFDLNEKMVRPDQLHGMRAAEPLSHEQHVAADGKGESVVCLGPLSSKFLVVD